MVTMDVLKSNQSRVQNLSPLEIWGFIAGRVLAAFGLGILAAQYFPKYAPQLGVPLLLVGVVLLALAATGLRRRPPSKD